MSELLVGHILDVDPTDLERASPFVVLVPAIKVSVEVNLKKLGKLSRINLMIFIQLISSGTLRRSVRFR